MQDGQINELIAENQNFQNVENQNLVKLTYFPSDSEFRDFKFINVLVQILYQIIILVM